MAGPDAADRRPDPDALLAVASAEGRGRLKIFLGAAPGVGKTWEMLSQARRRRESGVDVLAGVIETHGRAGTIAELADLPRLKLRDVAYRGQVLAEFDLEAALAARPGLLLVDELAHTNAPGSQHAKRWEDVADLVRAGIEVWATLNVQHLESLNDDVARITGVRVSETLPDHVLEQADEIELIDVPPAELRNRLREGRIYRADNAKRALEGFFREGNLSSLREMALRRAAVHVDSEVRAFLRRTGVSGAWPSAERVLALVGPDPGASAVVRHAKRLAEALRAPWTVLHVEHAASLLVARPALALAAQLGADIDSRVGTDLPGLALAVAEERSATHLVLGRGRIALWRRLSGRTFSAALMRRAPQIAIYIVPLAEPGRRPPRLRLSGPWWSWAGALALVAGVTALGRALADLVPVEAMGMVYLAAIVAGSSAWGMQVALAMAATSFLAWDVFFIPPLYTVTIDSPRDVIALLVFAAVAVLAGGMAGRVRGEAQAAQARVEGLRRIGAFSRTLGEAASEADLLAEIARQAAAIAGQALVLAPAGEDLAVRAMAGTDSVDEGASAAARWAWQRRSRRGKAPVRCPPPPGGCCRCIRCGRNSACWACAARNRWNRRRCRRWARSPTRRRSPGSACCWPGRAPGPRRWRRPSDCAPRCSPRSATTCAPRSPASRAPPARCAMPGRSCRRPPASICSTASSRMSAGWRASSPTSPSSPVSRAASSTRASRASRSATSWRRPRRG